MIRAYGRGDAGAATVPHRRREEKTTAREVSGRDEGERGGGIFMFCLLLPVVTKIHVD